MDQQMMMFSQVKLKYEKKNLPRALKIQQDTFRIERIDHFLEAYILAGNKPKQILSKYKCVTEIIKNLIKSFIYLMSDSPLFSSLKTCEVILQKIQPFSSFVYG